MAQQPGYRTNSAPTGTILHIGAGHCSRLADYLSAGPTGIVLVEPDPDRAADLRADTVGHAGVTVIEAAVSLDEGRVQLNRYNLADQNSLSVATDLRVLYPGLSQTDSVKVVSITPDALIDTLMLDEDAENWLILEAPGREAEIVGRMLEQNLLGRFHNLELVCGNEPLFEGSRPAGDVLQDLFRAGFRKAADLGDDPDWCHYHLVLDPDFHDLSCRHNTALAKLAEANDRMAALQKEVEQHAVMLQELTETHDAMRTELTETKDRAVNLQAEVESADGRAQTAERELRVALRLQTVAANDLSELQARFKSALETKEAQTLLLQKMSLRLTEASDYLHGYAASQEPANSTLQSMTADENADAPGAEMPPQAKTGD